jgi:hypothetical protein
MATTKTKPRVPGTPQPSSREDLEQRRHGVVAAGPSGNIYRVRQPNLQRHALTGGLPLKLRQMAMAGAQGVNRMFAGDDGALSEEGEETRQYLDRLVLAVIIEPELTVEDLGTGALDDDPLLPPIDYKWALEIGLMEQDRDGEGRLLWGRPPLSNWATFREHHDCPDPCPACEGVRDAWSVVGYG